MYQTKQLTTNKNHMIVTITDNYLLIMTISDNNDNMITLKYY